MGIRTGRSIGRPPDFSSHDLFPAAARARAVELLRLGVLLSWQPRFQEAQGSLADAWLDGVILSAVDRSGRLQPSSES